MNDEAREVRRTGLGGTDCAAILGLSPWKSPMSVFLDKTGQLEEVEDEKGAHLRNLGLELEPVIAGLYERETEKKLRKVLPPGIIRHARYDFLLGSPDRLVVGEPRGVELKTENPFQDNFGEPGTDQVPEHYLIQCAHYMMITGFDEWDIALLRGTSFAIYTIERDMELEQTILETLLAWWDKHIIGNVPPDADNSEAWSLYLAKKHPANILPIIDAEDEAAFLARRLIAGTSLRDKMDEQIDELKNKLKVIIGDSEGIRGESFGRITWRKTKDSISVDWEAAFKSMEAYAPEQYQQMLEKFTKKKEGHRRFVVTPAKKELDNGNGIHELNGATLGSAAQSGGPARIGQGADADNLPSPAGH